MIYILQVPSLEKFKDTFSEYKEVKINESTVLHLNKEIFFMFIMSNLNRQNIYLFNILQQILHDYKILQIEEI
jgi:hypothetical protein